MKISVAMCTYNGSKYLDQQLQSILSQTILIQEIIVCDDNSSDKTKYFLKTFENNYPGIFTIVYNDKTYGVKKNFEQAISLATGDIIFLSDQDDIWLPNKVEKILQAFNKNEKALAIFTDAVLINEFNVELPGTLWAKWGFDKNMQIKWNNNYFAYKQLMVGDNKVTGATLAFKIELKKNFLPFDNSEHLWHDSLISLHAASLKGLVFLDERLVKYRIHSTQQIGIGNGVFYRQSKKENSFFKNFTIKLLKHNK